MKQGASNASQAPQALGRRLEIQAAAQLKRNGADVRALTERISPAPGRTDVDIVVAEGIQLSYYQVKSTSGAFRSLPNAQAWVRKALADLGVDDYSRVKYIVPEGVTVPPTIKRWFDEVGVGVIDDLPLTFP